MFNLRIINTNITAIVWNMVPFAIPTVVVLLLFVSPVVLLVHADEVQIPTVEKVLKQNKSAVSSQRLLSEITTPGAVLNSGKDYPYRQRKQVFHDDRNTKLFDDNNIILSSINNDATILNECDMERLHQSCTGLFDDCGCASNHIECSLEQGLCVRSPRDYGEPCGIFNPCGEFSVDNPSMALECSFSCGICVAESESNLQKDALDALEQYEGKAVSPSTIDTSCLGGLESSSFFRTWARTELTSLPIVRPTNDNELRSILSAASLNGCKVRPMGTTHSAPGVVASEKDTNVVVVSLVDYIPNDNTGEGWEEVTIIEDGDQARVRVPGGYTQLQLYSIIRPLGYFLPTQTAGWLFSIAGIISNSVHGGRFGKSYVHSYVTALRVMLADGTIEIINAEEDLRMWRNGFGLLGFITAAEVQIEKRDTKDEYFWMGVESQTAPDDSSWNRAWLDEYISHIKQEYLAGDFFFDPYTKEILTIVQKSKPRTIVDNDCVWSYWKSQCVCNDACKEAGRTCSYQFKLGDLTLNQSCRLSDISFTPTTNNDCKFDYSTTQCRDQKYCSYQFQPGDMTLDQSCRLKSPPPPDVDTIRSSYSKALDEYPLLGFTGVDIGKDDTLQSIGCLAKQFGQEALIRQIVLAQIKQFVKDEYDTTNDGFVYREGVPLFSPYIGFMFPKEHLFDVLERISSLGFILTVPIEFRLVNVDDSAILMPGDQRNAEFVFMECRSLEIPGYTQSAWREQFFNIEQIFKSVGGFTHTGKYFGMGRDEIDGVFKPFQNVSSEDIFTTSQKNKFETYRKQIDPNDLFYAGFMAEYLQT